jgi:aspartate aminotransferase
MTHLLDSISFGAIVAVRDRLLAQQAAGRKIYRLESGDPSFDVPPHVREAIETALLRGQTHYTASTGIAPLREAAVKKFKCVNHLPIEHLDQVVVTNGAMHGLYLTFRALLEPGNEVILPDPMWTEIAENIRLAGGVPVRCNMLRQGTLSYRAADLEPLITPQTKAIFINTPHNPTGLVLERTVLQELVDLAVRRNLILISDEAYEHVIFDGCQHVSPGSLRGAEERTITLFSTSKSYAMSGLRVGFIATRQSLFLERVKKLLRCTTNGVNSLAQWGAAAALEGPQDATRNMCVEYQARRDALLQSLSGLRVLRPFVPKGSFFLWMSIDPSWDGYEGVRNSDAMTRMLIDKGGVGSSPGSAFGPAGEGFVRLAFSCDRPQVEEGAAVIRRLLS